MSKRTLHFYDSPILSVPSAHIQEKSVISSKAFQLFLRIRLRDFSVSLVKDREKVISGDDGGESGGYGLLTCRKYSLLCY